MESATRVRYTGWGADVTSGVDQERGDDTTGRVDNDQRSLGPRPAIVSWSVSELLRRAGDGDQVAWEEIVRRYHRLVLAKVRSFRLQESDAHDAVQMTWLRLMENCQRIQFPEHLGGWLATTAGRECLAILRHAERNLNLDDTAVENVADPSRCPEQQVIDRDTERTLRGLVAELAPGKRTVLRALFVDEPPPYAELARSTGMPLGSIGPTRGRALRQLRDQLEENQLKPAV